MSTFLRACLGTLAFAGLHSLLASHAAKRAAARIAGPRNTDRWSRAAYNAQAVATTVYLAVWLRKLPQQQVYEITGAARYAMRAGQIIALGMLATSVGSAGVLRFLAGSTRDIEAQGPAREGGRLLIRGPFKLQRHPTNFWALVLVALQPRMTDAGLGFALVSGVYSAAGSIHQDLRLRRVHGSAFHRYAARVPLFLPRWTA